MDISLIGANAGSVWNALHENGEMDLTKLKKETKLSEAEILAAIGWLAREGMEELWRCEEREGTLLFRSI